MTDTDEDRWSVRKLAVWFYPAAAATVAINLFLLGLLWQKIGWQTISPVNAIIWSIPLGIPAAWFCAKWIRGLMDEADGRK